MQDYPILALACSPRVGGNSDTIAHNFTKGVQSANGNIQTIYLRDYTINPCIACDHCLTDPQNKCIYNDDAATIFNKIEAASLIFIAAPIYFYHLPAQLKALIDRSQCYYGKKINGKHNINYSTKHAYAGLVAARSQGEKLFDGGILTLKYFFKVFNTTLNKTHKMYGYDLANDLNLDKKACSLFIDFGIQCTNNLLGKKHE